VTPNINIIYEALSKTCDVLDDLSCNYFLAGGTLLGACRDGDLIAHDIDFDLDCLIEDEEKILQASELFAEKGLTIKRKMSTIPRRFDTFEQTKTPLNASCIVVEYKGQHVGDLFIFTIFDDGIARRFDCKDGVYANSKMSIPAWYYSGNEFLSIRGRQFRSVRSPELVLEKIYGHDWQIPLKPGQFQSGRNKTSGSVADADIEKLIIHAIKDGWQVNHLNAPSWPQGIKWVAWPPKDCREWIVQHESMTRPEVANFLYDDTFLQLLRDATDYQRLALLKVLVSKTLKDESERLNELVFYSKNDCLLRRLYKALNLPNNIRAFISKIYQLSINWR
jgi:hypothetical protein